MGASQAASPHAARIAARDALATRALRAMHTLARGVDAADSTYLERLVRCVGELLGMDMAWVTEVVEDGVPCSVRIRAGWNSTEHALPRAYALAGTPCERVIRDGELSVTDGVAELFREDAWLGEVGAVSFFGVAVPGPGGAPCGHLCVVDSTPPDDVESVMGIVHLFADHAAREIERSRVETLLGTQRHILELIATGASVQVVLDRLCLDVERVVPDSVCSCMRLEGDVLRMLAAPSAGGSLCDTIDGLAVGRGNCGTSARTGEPALVADTSTDPLWADFRDVAERFSIAACWSLPILSRSEILGTFAISRGTPGNPTLAHLHVLETAAHLASIAMDRHRHAEHQRIMMQELDHRVKNNLAAVSALCEMTLASAESLDGFADAFDGRMRALARTHEVLSAGRWTGVDVAEALRVVVAPLAGDRLSSSGRPVRIPARAANPLGLALHELVTNAVKYGALSGAGGVSVTWSVEGCRLLVDWVESGGPAPAEAAEGFGLRLIRGLIEHEIGGWFEHRLAPGGFTCRIDLPLDGQGGAR